MSHKTAKRAFHEDRIDAKAYAVILVGGKGRRLHPISVDGKPKAFLPITKDDETMFGKTLDRIKKFIPIEHIIVVANKNQAELVKKDFPSIMRENLVLEPMSRNTAPAIALAASIIEKRVTDAIMLVLPSDHYIIGDGKYIKCLEKGVAFIRRYWWDDPLIVVGIKPRFPATGFGYIKLKSGSNKSKSGNIYEVEKFVEKPNFKTAKAFLEDGRYMWNSGMFIFKASSIMRQIERFAPGISNAVRQLGTVRIDALYKKLPDISIDYAVMEKAHTIYCVKGAYGWEDMGNLASLKEVLEKELKPVEKKKHAGYTGKEPVSLQILERLREITL